MGGDHAVAEIGPAEAGELEVARRAPARLQVGGRLLPAETEPGEAPERRDLPEEAVDQLAGPPDGERVERVALQVVEHAVLHLGPRPRCSGLEAPVHGFFLASPKPQQTR